MLYHCLVIVLCGIFAIQTYQSIETYLQEDVGKVMRSATSEEIPMPAMTICTGPINMAKENVFNLTEAMMTLPKLEEIVHQVYLVGYIDM